MITIAQFSVDEILPHLGTGKPKKWFSTPRGNFLVKMSSPRLECLRRRQKCVSCSITGNVWLLQSHVLGSPKVSHNCFIENDCPWCSLKPAKKQGGDNPHLNLYRKLPSGLLTLMTQDHIVPKSAGGSDKVDNLQTMCQQCNQLKGAMSQDEFSNKYHRTIKRMDAGSASSGRSSEVSVHADDFAIASGF